MKGVNRHNGMKGPAATGKPRHAGKMRAWFAIASLLFFAAPSLAVTDEDIVRSFNEHMVQEPDYTAFIPWLLGLAAVVIIVIYVRQRQKIAAVPKALNHPGKLVREMTKLADIDSAEMKKYKAIARQMQVESPLTLMLCPSLLNAPLPGAPQEAGQPSEEPDRSNP